MLKRALVGLLLSLFCAGMGWAHDPNHVEGSGKIVTDKRVVADFSAIELDGAFDTVVVCQEKKRLEITGDDNIVPLIKTEVKDGVLHIYAEKSFSTRKMFKVVIGMQTLDKLAVSGANEVSVEKVKSGRLRLEADGSSTITIAGRAGSVSSDLSGAATLQAGKLEAEDVSVNISGAGNAEVYASQKLDAQIMGAGSVVYAGNPKDVSRQVLGAGSIEPR